MFGGVFLWKKLRCLWAMMLSRVNHDWCWISESSTESFQLNTRGLYGFGLYTSEQKNSSEPCVLKFWTPPLHNQPASAAACTFSYLNQLLKFCGLGYCAKATLFLLLPANGVSEHPRWWRIPASTSLAELRNCSSWLFIPIYILITYML